MPTHKMYATTCVEKETASTGNCFDASTTYKCVIALIKNLRKIYEI